jgi:hypothetical protein
MSRKALICTALESYVHVNYSSGRFDICLSALKQDLTAIAPSSPPPRLWSWQVLVTNFALDIQLRYLCYSSVRSDSLKHCICWFLAHVQQVLIPQSQFTNHTFVGRLAKCGSSYFLFMQLTAAGISNSVMHKMTAWMRSCVLEMGNKLRED